MAGETREPPSLRPQPASLRPQPASLRPQPASLRPQPPSLRGFQKRWLRAQAHPLRPLVQVGDGGVNEAVVSALDRALLDHELVKVRLLQPPDKRAAADALAQATGSELCGLVGHTVILYRPHPENPRLELPERA